MRSNFPLTRFHEVTPSDASAQPFESRGVYVGVAGDLKITSVDGQTVVLKDLVAGIWHPMEVTHIWQNGTEATDIVIGA